MPIQCHTIYKPTCGALAYVYKETGYEISNFDKCQHLKSETFFQFPFQRYEFRQLCSVGCSGKLSSGVFSLTMATLHECFLVVSSREAMGRPPESSIFLEIVLPS